MFPVCLAGGHPILEAENYLPLWGKPPYREKKRTNVSHLSVPSPQNGILQKAPGCRPEESEWAFLLGGGYSGLRAQGPLFPVHPVFTPSNQKQPKKTLMWLWVRIKETPGEHQNRWQMDVHPPQTGAIVSAPWPCSAKGHGVYPVTWGTLKVHHQDTTFALERSAQSTAGI